ncbi:MAG: aldo/keto reductase [Pseudomonadota bacterium]|nr:aldo/keto reductase [Pseudomonadota bacterium]
MEYRTLGKSGLRVSEIGLGCWQFGGDFGPIDETTVDAILDAAAEEGISFYDTADVYGAGRSETLIGKRFAAGKGDAVIATKVGRAATLYPDKYEYDAVRASVAASARRLGAEALDLVQLHCVPTDVLRGGGIFDIMNQLRDEGLVRNWGASVETIEEAKICLEQDNLVSLQIIFNLFRQDAAWDLLPQAAAKNVGVIVRLPLASGLLSGKFRADETFAPGDHRNYNRDGAAFSVGETFSGLELATGVALVEELRAFVPDGWSMADLALRWILDHPAVSSVIAGCSKPAQARDNARAASLPALPRETHETLRRFYEDRVRPAIRCPI